MFHIVGDTIYYDGKPVAWLTIPNGTLRAAVTEAFDELPDARPLQEALSTYHDAKGLTQLAVTADALALHVEAWLNELKDTNTARLL